MYCSCCGDVIEPDECDSEDLCTACAESFNEEQNLNDLFEELIE
jgi:hypothetical protein